MPLFPIVGKYSKQPIERKVKGKFPTLPYLHYPFQNPDTPETEGYLSKTYLRWGTINPVCKVMT